MAITQLAPPYPIFTDRDGSPLDAGYLYFGEVNQNPETNPIQIYYDSAFTIPAAQPLRTSNGYVMRNGSPAIVFAGSQFSVTVRNKKSELVIYSPVGYGVDPASVSGSVIYDDFTGDGVTTAFTITATPSTKNATSVYIDGVYQSKNNYNTSGSTLTFSTAPPLLSAIEVVSQESSIIGGASSQQITYNQGGTGAVSRTVQGRLQDFVSVKDFGAVGDGVTDDTVAIQSAINYSVTGGKNLYVPPGTYIISSMVYEQTNGGRLNIFGAGKSSSIFKGSAALVNTAMFWFGNNSGHAVYALVMQNIGLDGASTTNCTGIVATEAGLSHFSNMRIYDWQEGANCDGSIHMIWDGHNEVISCRYGIRFRRIPPGVPSGPFDKSVTQNPIAIATNISKIENTWFTGLVEQAIVMEGGLVTVENCVFQAVGINASSSLVYFDACNESYDYGGGPRFINNWIEGGTYKYWVEVIFSRNAVLKDNFYSGPGSTGEGAFLLRDGAENCIISGNSFRGAATAVPTEGRNRSSAAVYLDAASPLDFAFTIRDNYLTKATLNYVISGVNITGDNSWRYSTFSDMNGTPPAVYNDSNSLVYMPDKTVHAAGCVSYSGGIPTIDFASNVLLIADSGPGYVTIQYARRKAFNNQPFVASVAENSTGAPFFVTTIRSNTSVDRVRVYNSSGVATDPDSISFVCYGGTE